MKLSSFRITDEHHIKESPFDEGASAWFDDPIHRWLDVEAPTQEELTSLLAPLGVELGSLEARADTGFGFLGEILERGILFRIPTLVDPESTELTHVVFLCFPTTVVTIHPKPLPAIAGLQMRLAGRVRLKSPTTSALVYQVVGRLAAENFFAFTACRQKLDELAVRLIDDSESVEPEDIFSLRRWVTNIGDTNEDHAFCVDILQKQESTSFSVAELAVHFRELEGTLARHQRSMDRLEENAKDLHQQFLLAIQDRTGNRLRVLTILSAVFMPLTLIAGIYGMNFANMPELHLRFGYPAALGVMVLMGVGMLVYFRRKGWFD